MNSHIINKAKKYVNNLLEPLENHYYHNFKHAKDVSKRAVYLWEKEWLCDSDLEILALSGLFHDAGFILQYDYNEPIWAKIAQNYLKSVLYPSGKIKKIEEIILATSVTYKPKNIYEKIIKDADLDNLWWEEFFEINHSLKKEIELIKDIKIDYSDWINWTIEFLKEHKYYTDTQKHERNIQKQENLNTLSEELNNKK